MSLLGSFLVALLQAYDTIIQETGMNPVFPPLRPGGKHRDMTESYKGSVLAGTGPLLSLNTGLVAVSMEVTV